MPIASQAGSAGFIGLVGLGALCVGTAPAWCQTAPARPATHTAPALATVTSGPVRLRVLEVRWRPYDEVKPSYWPDSIPRPPFFLTVKFAVDGVPLDDDGDPLEERVRVYVVDADGNRLDPDEEANLPAGTAVWRDMSSLVDPRLRPLKLHFDFLAPFPEAGPTLPGAELVTFAHVPLPAPADDLQPLPGGPITQTTPTGIRVSLDQGATTGLGYRGSKTYVRFRGRWLPPLNNPGANVTVGRPDGINRQPVLAYDNDAGDNVGQGIFDVVRLKNSGDTVPGAFTVSALPPAAAAAKTATITVEVDPVQGDPPVQKSFDVTLPMPAPPLRNSPLPDPIQVQPLGDGKILLEPLHFRPERGYKVVWRGQLLFQMPTSQIGDTAWTSDTVQYKFPSGSGGSTGLGADWPWRPNGAPIGPNEMACQAVPMLFNEDLSKPMPTSFGMDISCENIKSTTFALPFKDLPVPAEGQIVPANALAEAGAYGSFIVRRVGWFNEANPLTPRVTEKAELMEPPYGLAIVVEHIPKDPEGTFDWDLRDNAASWSLDTTEARDSTGRSLLRVADQWDGRDLPTRDDLATTDAGPDHYFATFYALPPAPGAKTFRFTLHAVRREVLQSQIVTFKDVPLPPVPADALK